MTTTWLAPSRCSSLAFLLEHLPPGSHPVLASRAVRPALARLRARGQLTELRDAELRFTAEEAAAFLRETAGAELPETAVAALAARTEGWAAGLQLAALSLHGQRDVDHFVTAFTGSHRFVLDYLAKEVLERQSEQIRSFLLETSVLQRLSGPLSDAVTGRTGSQALLEQVERAGLFLLPLDEVRGWWRYHQLFADLLRARLEPQSARATQLHHNAAAWFCEHHLADDAIRHAVAAGGCWAAQLIEQHFDDSSTCTARCPRCRVAAALPRGSSWRTAPPAAGAGPAGSARRPPGGGGRLVDTGGARLGRCRRGVRAFRRASVEPAGECPGGQRAAAHVPGRALRPPSPGPRRARSGRVPGGRDDAHLDRRWYAACQWLGGRPAVAERMLSPAVGQRSTVGEGFLAAWICHILSRAQRSAGRGTPRS